MIANLSDYLLGDKALSLDALQDFSFGDTALLDILIVPLTLALCWGLMKVFLLGVSPAIRKLTDNVKSLNGETLAENITTPITFLLTTFLLAWLSSTIKTEAEVLKIFETTLVNLTYMGVAWLCFRLVDSYADHQTLTYKKKKQRKRASTVPLIKRTTKALLAVIMLVFILQNAGVNVSALIAGLGIGGIAIALAAQKTVENVFGGLVMIFDQPLRVGDYIKADNIAGTVEDITWRSTRIRTLERTLISVPNADMSQMKIENFAKRERIRIYTVLGIRYECSTDQIRFLLTELKKILLAHPKLDQDDIRVRLAEFGAYSVNVELAAYAKTTDYEEFLAIREDVFLRIMDIVTSSGVEFAFPSQTLYMERTAGFDRETQAKVEKSLNQAKKEQRVFVPDVPEKDRTKLKGTLIYPPEGAALDKKA